ncbi:unnamed protein product [Anisakis simplex]|uniref:Origin recognition complex subunit 6 n=1 Tax=Anisakis simplex TaxID=6269 RepID=A0A0M3JAF5_ANISI|nr:unnamed protein product [Anisakis simplex]
MDDQEETPVDFELLLYDHVANAEPKLLNKMYSATKRASLEQKRRSSGKFKSLKEVVGEYNNIVSRKRAATESPNKTPAAKRQSRRGEMADSSDSSDSDEHPVKIAAVCFHFQLHDL